MAHGKWMELNKFTYEPTFSDSTAQIFHSTLACLPVEGKKDRPMLDKQRQTMVPKH